MNFLNEISNFASSVMTSSSVSKICGKRIRSMDISIRPGKLVITIPDIDENAEIDVETLSSSSGMFEIDKLKKMNGMEEIRKMEETKAKEIEETEAKETKANAKEIEGSPPLKRRKIVVEIEDSDDENEENENSEDDNSESNSDESEESDEDSEDDSSESENKEDEDYDAEDEDSHGLEKQDQEQKRKQEDRRQGQEERNSSNKRYNFRVAPQTSDAKFKFQVQNVLNTIGRGDSKRQVDWLRQIWDAAIAGKIQIRPIKNYEITTRCGACHYSHRDCTNEMKIGDAPWCPVGNHCYPKIRALKKLYDHINSGGSDRLTFLLKLENSADSHWSYIERK